MQLNIDEVGKLVALGGAFTTHVGENNSTKWPDLWVVSNETLISPGQPIVIPPEVKNVIIGPEITVVIGESIYRASKAEAAEAVRGYTITNDVTAKGEWPAYSYENVEHITGVGYKIFPTFRPVLDSYVSLDPDEVRDLDVEATVDGKTVVSGSTKSMAFSVSELVSHASKIVHLHEGDLLALGDPGNPSGYIDDASVVTCRIEKLGELTNRVARLDT